MRRITVIMLLLSLMVFLSGCGSSTEATHSDPEVTANRKILFVTDEITEKRSCEIWKLLQEAAEGRPAQVTLAEVNAQSDKTAATLNQASEGLYDTVILDKLSGEAASEWIKRNAGYYPEVRYLCLDVPVWQEQQPDNVMCIIWNDDPVYYLLGAVAAAGSRHASLAFLAQVAGERSERNFLAFYQGAISIVPEIKVQYIVTAEKASDEEIVAAAKKARMAGADLICLQNDDYIKPLQADAENHPEDWEETYFVAGDIPLAMKADHTTENLLLDAEYPTEQLLTVLFERCCREETDGGVIEMGLQEGKMSLSYGDVYSSLLDLDEKSACAAIKKKIIEGTLFVLSGAEISEEERQILIQKAAGTK